MQNDERQIRTLVATWMAATQAGDVDTLLSLMAEDAVFLAPGRPPMRKREFEAAAKAGRAPPPFDGSSDIEEIVVLGGWAFMRTRLTVVATPADGSPPTELAGHTLTILRKDGGKWLLARDANLLSPVQRPHS